MSTVRVKDKNFALYLSAAEIKKRVGEVAAQISHDVLGKNPLFLSVLNGSFVFAADLLRGIEGECEISFVRLSSYQGMESTGTVRQLIGLNKDIAGRLVVVVEDIIDSGETMKELLQMLHDKNVADVKVVSLLVKPANLKVDIPIDYRCFDIPNDFIVGYGLDYDGYGRNLADIYVVSKD